MDGFYGRLIKIDLNDQSFSVEPIAGETLKRFRRAEALGTHRSGPPSPFLRQGTPPLKDRGPRTRLPFLLPACHYPGSDLTPKGGQPFRAKNKYPA